MKTFRVLFIALLMLMSFNTFAKKFTQQFFAGCHPVGFEFIEDSIVLNPIQAAETQQTLYLIHNRSTRDLIIKANNDTNGMLFPSLTVDLSGDNWGAFAVHDPGVTFSCYNEYGEIVNCKEALGVCQYPRAKFTIANRGTYWVSANRPKFIARDEAIHKGILLRNWYPGWKAEPESEQIN